MGYVRNQIIKLNHFHDVRVEQVAIKAMLDNYDEIIDKLRFQWKQEELMSDGTKTWVTPYYAPSTSDWADAYPPRGEAGGKTTQDRFDFDWTGELYGAMSLKIDGKKQEFEILSIPWKIEAIKSNSSMRDREFMSLTPNNNEKINDQYILPAVYNELLKTLQRL